MKLWWVDLNFWDGHSRTWNQMYHVFMTDVQAKQLAATLEGSRVKEGPYRDDDLVSFEVAPMESLTYGFREFMEDVERHHATLFQKLGKRWTPEAE